MPDLGKEEERTTSEFLQKLPANSWDVLTYSLVFSINWINFVLNMCLYVYIFAQCGTFQLILMEVKCAQSKENCNTNLEACKDKQGVSSLFSTRHAFMLINWLQEKNPISRESHCQTIKSQHTILKLIENDGKTSISSSTNFGSIKAASKGASQSVSFPVSNQVQSVQTEGWIYLCSIKDE